MQQIMKRDQVPRQRGALASRAVHRTEMGEAEPEGQGSLTEDQHGTRWPAAQS